MKSPELKRCLKAFALLAVFFLCTGWTPFYYEGTYKGKVVDSKIGEPIEGAVALATWSKCYPTPAGEVCDYYDAQDAVTNEKGEFELPGQGIRAFTFLGKMGVGIFKTGYRFASAPSRGEGSKEDGRMVTKLLKLTLEQRRKVALSFGGFPPAPPAKAPLYQVLMYSKERKKELTEIDISSARGD